MRWEEKPLGDLCSIQLGKTPARKSPRFWDPDKETENVWLSISDLSHGQVVGDSVEYVSNEALSIMKVVPEGTLMVSFKLTLGRTSFAARDLYTNEAIAAILNLDHSVNQRFLMHFFDRFDWKKACEGDEKLKGYTFNKAKLNVLEIPIPPLEEQERIVEVLDEAFAAIDKAKANIERNLINARELFQSRLNDIFSNPSEDWEIRPLGEISAIRYGHTDKSNADFRGPKFLRITDIQDGVVNWESVPRCNPMTEQDWAKYELRKGDIVFARTGATTGKSFLLRDVEDAVFASYLIRVRLHQLDAAPFVALFFESPEYWAVVAEGTTGSAQGGFNAKKLSSLSIPLPPREVQAEVIMELSELRRNVRNLEDGYQAELNSLEELRQSILEQAFEGKLTEPVAA